MNIYIIFTLFILNFNSAGYKCQAVYDSVLKIFITADYIQSNVIYFMDILFHTDRLVKSVYY